MIPYKQCTCGRSYSWEQWQALECRGVQEGDGADVDLRNCPHCHQTMGVILRPIPIGAIDDPDEWRDAMSATVEFLLRNATEDNYELAFMNDRVERLEEILVP